MRFCGQCGRALSIGAAAPVAARHGAPEAEVETRERRPLTIVFCDLVASTRLSALLDPEDFSTLIREYFRAAAETFERHGGHVDKEEGDLLRVYFGYPRAHDDDAVRAAHAALEVLKVVAALSPSLPLPSGDELQVRVGVHTGEAIVHEAGQPRPPHAPLVLGEAPNIAKRVQEAAAPGTVMIGETTRRIVERAFVCESTGRIRIAGLERHETVHRLLSRRGATRSIDGFATRSLAPLIGRSEELAILTRRWALAANGCGQVVLVSGEPGIGKSRLLHSFVSGLSAASAHVLSAQCLEPYANSALYPFFDLLRRELNLRRDEPLDDRLERVKKAIGAGRLPPSPSDNVLGSLVALSSLAIPADTSPRLHREQLLDWLARWILLSTADRPIVLLVEDTHWADASTMDLLVLLFERVASARALVLLSFRTGHESGWPMRAHFSQLALSRLAVHETRQLVRNIAGAERFEESLVATIAARSDGVPLFVEELTRMLVDAGIQESPTSQPSGAGAAGRVPIPETLRGSLAARLDQLGASKHVAQTAAVLGREFSHALLKHLIDVHERTLQQALSELVEAGLLFQREGESEVSYAFKHALIQEAAYASLLKPRRTELHGRTAMVLLEHFGDIAAQHPELVAHHFACAGRDVQAVEHWHRAGVRDVEASADVEALAHLRAALGQIERSTARASLVEREIECLVTLGSALTSVQGYAAAEVEHAFGRAHDLCARLPDKEPLYRALTGLHSFYQVRGPLSRAVELGERLLEIARDSSDVLRRAQAHRCLGWALFCCGRLVEGRTHLDAALGLFDDLRSNEHSRLYGAHPWVVGHVNSALLEWFAGRTALSFERSARAIELARALRRPLALAYALCMTAAVHCSRRDVRSTLAHANEVLELANRFTMPYWAAWARTLRGWALAHAGEPARGIAEMLEGLERYRATGARLFEPSTLGLLAECHSLAGNAAAARLAIDEALGSDIVAGGYFASPELLRISGEQLLIAGAGIDAAALPLRRAIELGLQQQAWSSLLRAARVLGEHAPEALHGETRRLVVAAAVSVLAQDPSHADARRVHEWLAAMDEQPRLQRG